MRSLPRGALLIFEHSDQHVCGPLWGRTFSAAPSAPCL